MHSIKNWQGIPTTHLTLDGEVMVPRDNSTLAFSTELLNCIIPFAIQEKSRHYKIFDGWPRGFLLQHWKNLLWSFEMQAKVMVYSLQFINLHTHCSLVSVRLPPEEANRSKQGNLSFSHIIACSPAFHLWQFSETTLGEGHVLPHALVLP